MGSDSDDNDTDYNVGKGRGGKWTPRYVSRFAKLLLDNTVVLKNLHNYLKDDPIHQLRNHAMEHLQAQLKLKSPDQVRNQINCFKKVAANKLRHYAAKSPGSSPAEILKTAPRWLRDLEPHFSVWTRAMAKYKKKPKARQADSAAVPEAPTKPVDRVIGLALELVKAARTARTLDARVVCSKLQLQDLPDASIEELQYVWWRMLDVVRQKLALVRDTGDNTEDTEGTRFSAVESLLADLVILFDDTISTVTENGDYDSMQALVSLFHLAQLFRLEEPEGQAASRAKWRRAHQSYRASATVVGSVSSSIILMQRRWHEMKLAARRAIAEYAKGNVPPPSPLYAALAKRFPHIVTKPIVSWRELVNSGAVIEVDEKGTNIDEELVDPSDVETLNILDARELLHYERCEAFERFAAPTLMSLSISGLLQRPAKEDEDDIILIEKEIETIDLINTDESDGSGTRPPHDDACGDGLQGQLLTKRNTFANQLEMELDRQITDVESGAGASVMAILQASETAGDPEFIYDSEDEIIECNEDRMRNIEMIAAQIGEETAGPVILKLKSELAVNVDTYVDKVASDVNNERNETDEDANEDNETAFDEKLLMETTITLVKVNETAEWRKFASKRHNSIDLNKLNLTLFAPKRVREKTPPSVAEDLQDPTLGQGSEPMTSILKVKIERLDDECSTERQVKSMARKRISEMLRDEAGAGAAGAGAAGAGAAGAGALARRVRTVRDMITYSDDDDDASNRVTKKVQLPNIEEVRRNNKSMLMAQVAPLLADIESKSKQAEGVERAENTAEDSRRVSTDSSDALQIDESSEETISDLNISKNHLDRVLKKLAQERVEEKRADGPFMTPHCCTARRQRALNAARRRLALRRHRPPPPPTDIHTNSRCAGKCVCCCKHLLKERGAGAKLQKEAREIEAALSRLLGESNEPDSGTENTNKTKKVRPPKKPSPTPEQTEQDPLQEWIRQKNLNSQYFNLNLKTKSPDDMRKSLLVPTTTDHKVIYSQKAPPPNLVVSSVDGKVAVPRTVSQTAENPSRTSVSTTIPLPEKTSQPSVFTTIPLPKVTVPTSTRKVLMTSLHDVVASPLKSGPGTLVKLTPVTNTQSATPPTQSTTPPTQSTTPPTVSIVKSKHPFPVGTVVKLAPVMKPPPAVPMQSATLSTARSAHTFSVQSVPPQRTVAQTSISPTSLTRPLKYVTVSTSKVTTAPTPPSSVPTVPSTTPSPQLKLVQNTGGSSVTVPRIREVTLKTKSTKQQPLILKSRNCTPVRIGPKPPLITTDVSKASDVSKAGDVSNVSDVNKASDVSAVNKPKEEPKKLVIQVYKLDEFNHTGQSRIKVVQSQVSNDQDHPEVRGASPSVPKDTPRQATDVTLRGTGLKVVKISSKAVPTGLPVPSEPRSLLRDPPGAGAAPPARRMVVFSKNGTRTTKEMTLVTPKSFIGTKVRGVPNTSLLKPPLSPAKMAGPTVHKTSNFRIINPGSDDSAFATPLLGGGAILTRLSTGTESTPAGEYNDAGARAGGDASSAAVIAPATSDFDSLLTSDEQLLHPEKHYKRRDLTTRLDEFLRNQDPTNMVVQCFGDTLFTILDSYYILAESDLPVANPAYWTLAAVPHSRRILLDERGSKDPVQGSGPGLVLASPYKMCLDQKVYIKLKDHPLMYARVFRAVATPVDCRAELSAGTPLQFCHAATGRRAPLSRDVSLPNTLAIMSPELTAVKALALALNKLGSPAVPLAAAKSRTDANARADVVMMMNNVNRKPIEMVYVDSDDEDKGGAVKTETRFKGLENFEDMEDFEL